MIKSPPKLSIAERIASGANLSINEVATYAGVGRVKVYAEIAAERLKVIKIGRRTLVRPNDAKQWLDALVSVGVKAEVASDEQVGG